jgi:hypothetical protein
VIHFHLYRIVPHCGTNNALYRGMRINVVRVRIIIVTPTKGNHHLLCPQTKKGQRQPNHSFFGS